MSEKTKETPKVINDETIVNLSISIKQVNIILASLAEQKYSVVSEVIGVIHSQVTPQIQ